MSGGTVLRLAGVSKKFRVYRSERTLFRYLMRTLSGEPIHDTLWALRGVDLELRRGDKVAVLGRNGAGKSTLLRLAAGIYGPSSGTIERSEPGLALFRYGVGMQADLPVIENILTTGAFYRIPLARLRERSEAILRFSGLEHLRYHPVKRLSSGQVQRLNFSIFLEAGFSFLVFDESTSMADIEFRARAAVALRELLRSDKTVLLATHQLDFAAQNCDRAIWLEDGRVVQSGGVREVSEAYEAFCEKLARGPAVNAGKAAI
ncbi:MAG: Teichoic acids export ATP-binding protein TagH [Candidatus Omnitrophica bacterium]|nr:Teichoic acids export ATP-binding protein TagH [Candidatus Omnitrophota bacterium]